MSEEIASLEREIESLKERLARARHAAAREIVENQLLLTLGGPVALLDLFTDRTELWVVHNMGKSCPYCTLWADGLNGQLLHLENRAAIVLISPDPPEVQREFATSRNWGFAMASDQDKAFTTAMGFWTDKEGWWPGVSGFQREGDAIYRTGKAIFGPGDEFCPIWPMMDLLGGDKGWEPEVAYTEPFTGSDRS